MRLRFLPLVAILLPTMSPAPARQSVNGAWEKPLAPGIVYRYELDTVTPRQIHALRLTPGRPGLKLRADLAGGTIDEEDTTKGRATPTQIAARTSAFAAVNGDFFSFDHGAPIGITVRDGELLHTAVKTRAVFAWGPKTVAVGMVQTQITLKVDGQAEIPVTSMNQPIGDTGLALYTPTQGRLTPRPDALLIALAIPNVVWAPSTEIKATVASVALTAGPVNVPTGRAYLVAAGSRRSAVESLKPGQEISIKCVSTGFDWEQIDNVIGGGPMLVRDGKTAIDADAEGFNASFSQNRHPRTAIGRTSDGDIWIVVIDGRQPQSAGATLDETASLMRRFGCIDAINLDGGGSSAIHVRGVTVNKPSDPTERPVSNALVVFAPKVASPTGTLRMVVAPRVMPDGTVQARLDLDRKPVPNVEVLWTARGAAWVDAAGRVQFTKAGAATIYAQAYGQVLKADVNWAPAGR